MTDPAEIPQAEQDAALRQLLLIAEQVLDDGPPLQEADRIEGMRLVLKALTAVTIAEGQMRAAFRQRYPGSYFYADVPHLVAVAVDAEMHGVPVDEYAPYSVMAQGMLAFAAACVAADNAGNLSGALDAELFVASASLALDNMGPEEAKEPEELDKPENLGDG